MSNGLFNTGRNLLDTAGQYYLGKEGQEGATAAGQAALATGEQIGQTGAGLAEFKPYTVTSNLVQSAATTPEGGLALTLSPEEQARQNQYLAQSQGLFGGVGQDVAAGSQALYEQIRAAQQPEEERQRMAMQQGLFSSGRGGISSAAYGGTPEQLAYEKARQEAMLNAQLAARTQFGTEQDRLLTQAQGLQTAGYNPQRQAIDLFGASATPADIAGAGRRQGASIYGTSAIQGLEGMMQGEQLANELRQQQIQAILGGVTGSRNPETGQLDPGAAESFFDYLLGRNNISLNPSYRPTDTVQDVGDVLDLGEDFDITKE